MNSSPVKALLYVVLILCFHSPPAIYAVNSLYFIHTDHLGSTVAVTDEEGEIVFQNRHFPYGSGRLPAVSGQLSATERNYTSQIKDNETQLYYYNARYYDPALGTFISADPAGDGLNRFGYVHGNPINFIDPWGSVVRRASPYAGLVGAGKLEKVLGSKAPIELNSANPDSMNRVSPIFFWWQTDEDTSRERLQAYAEDEHHFNTNEIFLSDSDSVGEFLSDFRDVAPRGSSVLDQIQEISQAYRETYSGKDSFYFGACMGDAGDTFVLLHELAGIESTFLDVVLVNGTFGETASHSVLGIFADDIWYIIDNTRGLGPETSQPMTIESYQDFLKGKGFELGEVPFALPAGGDPFGLFEGQNPEWLRKPPDESLWK